MTTFSNLIAHAIFPRNGGYVPAIKFSNGNLAVSTKTFKTKNGAVSLVKRVTEICGDKFTREGNDLPWETTNPETGEVTVHFRHEVGDANAI